MAGECKKCGGVLLWCKCPYIYQPQPEPAESEASAGDVGNLLEISLADVREARAEATAQERARIVAKLRAEEQRFDAEPVASEWSAHCYTAADVANTIGNLADDIEGGE